MGDSKWHDPRDATPHNQKPTRDDGTYRYTIRHVIDRHASTQSTGVKCRLATKKTSLFSGFGSLEMCYPLMCRDDRIS